MISTKSFAVLGILLAAGLALFGLQIKNAVIKGREFDRYFTVRGLSEKVVKSTVVIWPLHYSLAEEELPLLKQSMEKAKAQITAFLVENGIEQNEISVGLPRIDDTIGMRRRGDAVVLPRYTANSSIVVRSTKVDLIKSVILKSSSLLDKGICLVGGGYGEQVQFLFEGVNEIKPAMIAEATANARAAADKFASDSKAKVGAIRRATQGVVEIEDRDPATPELKVVRVVTTIDFFIE